jgi:hypothetical protein
METTNIPAENYISIMYLTQKITLTPLALFIQAKCLPSYFLKPK